jgi:cell division protein FtsW
MSGLSREQKPAPEAEIRSRVFEGDRSLWIIFTVLLVISILVVYSSTAKMTYDTAANMSLFDALQKQVMYVMLSIMAIFVTHKIHYKTYMRWTYVAYILSILLTVAVYVVGEKTNDAARWLSIGPIKFQPSEALKIATILMLARAMESRQAVIDTLKIIPTSFKFRSPEQL